VKTYEFFLESGTIAAGTFTQVPFGEFRTSSKNKLIRALILAAGGNVALASGHDRLVARYKNRMIEGVTVYDRSDNALYRKLAESAAA
jgi:hypothetical protein